MSRVAFLALIGGALALSCTTPTPAPAPLPPDVTTVTVLDGSMPEGAPLPGDGGDIYDWACARLQHFGCQEGFTLPGGDDCADRLRREDRANVRDVKAACVAGAVTIASVKACGPYCRRMAP